MIGYFRRMWRHFLDDTLFRNSIYLMLTTGVMGAFGFFFWLIAAHLFTPDEIGVGTSLISVMSLISVISMLGFNSTFIRILPNSTNRNNEINTGSLLVVAASVIMAVIYLFGARYFAPSLEIVRANVWYAAGFVVMVSLASVNTLTDSIFVAYRSAQFTLITDGFVTSGVKLVLPLAFVALGAYGVFASAGLAASAGMIASIVYLIVKFGYRPQFRIHFPTLRAVFHYSFTNYLANLFSVVPTLILPIIILNHLGGAAAGYFFLAFMIANLIYAIPVAISGSLFAEGSYGTQSLRMLARRSTWMLVAIMVPVAVIFAAIGPFILGFFGSAYSAGGASTIAILALAAPAVAGFNIGSSLLRITKQVYALVVVNILYAIMVCVCSLEWAAKGPGWVALAWLAGNLLAAVLCFVFLASGHRRHLRAQTQAAAATL